MATEERSSGIILRTRLLTETSLIVHWLTPELGRIATVAKGARRPKSPFRGKLDLFYAAEFSFGRSAKSDLHTLREVVLRDTNAALRRDLGALKQAAYCAALIEQTTETETPLGDVFGLMRDLLAHLAEHKPAPALVLAFELKLLNELGLGPNLDEARLSQSGRVLAAQLLGKQNLPKESSTDPEAIESLRQFLHGFLIYHLGRIPRGRSSAANATS